MCVGTHVDVPQRPFLAVSGKDSHQELHAEMSGVSEAEFDEVGPFQQAWCFCLSGILHALLGVVERPEYVPESG